jgi:hypothetical protein
MPIVLNPTAGDVHVNAPLTNFSQKWLQDSANFQALSGMPNAPVSKQSDLYYEFSRADFFRRQAQIRADGTESQGASWKLSTNPYFAHVYALHKDVTDRQRANADNQVRLEESTAQFLTQQLMLEREILFQETFMPAGAASGIWASEWVGAVTGDQIADFVFWDRADSDPISDIRVASEAIQLATGKRPNRLMMGQTTWNDLVENDAILARINGGATTSLPAIVMRTLVAQLFELEQLSVMAGVVNTGLETTAADINDGEVNAWINDDTALLYFSPSGVALDQPTAGMQFSWNGFMGATDAGLRIKRFRHEPTESDRIEAQMSFDYRVTSPELGHYFHNTRT